MARGERQPADSDLAILPRATSPALRVHIRVVSNIADVARSLATIPPAGKIELLSPWMKPAQLLEKLDMLAM